MAFFDFLKRKRKKEEPASLASIPSRSGPKREQGGHADAKKDSIQAPEKKITREGRTRAVSERMLADVIRPHVTERSRENSQRGVYTFRVSEEATKHTIKQAIEALYRVAVRRVRVMRIPSKPRRRGLTRGTKKGYKKAAVLLRAGEHIDLFS